MPNQRPPKSFIVEPIEPRILYSADLNPLLLASAGTTALSADSLHGATTHMSANVTALAIHSAKTSATQVLTHEVVFIDSGINGYQQLAQTIQQENSSTRSIDVLIIDAGKDGIAQVSAALSSRQDVNAIHLISHGEQGEIQLGDTRFNNDSLLSHAAAVSRWSSALATGADILLYGCDVAATPEGQSFVQGLAMLTGADVNASTDLTGNATVGGNWMLEYATGQIEANGVVNYAAQTQVQEVLASFTVTNTSDSGAGSLRQAIIDANANAGADTISFAIGGGSVQSIALSSALPTISDVVMIDGTTETGYTTAPLIEINGTSAGEAASGLTLTSGASGSTINSLIINRFNDSGIYLNGASNVTIIGNYLGTDSSGSAASANAVNGIRIVSSANNNIIGGTTASQRNIISGNSADAIRIDASTGTLIQGNYIGFNSAGTSTIGNGYAGISMVAASDNTTIGGTAVGAGNVISGNGHEGIFMLACSNNIIQGNYIGINPAGNGTYGNSHEGIYMYGSSFNTIGGTSAAARNIISGNMHQGMVMNAGSNNNTISGNYFSLNAEGNAKLNNNWSNIMIISSTGNTVGGTTAGERNVIAGSNYDGVEFSSASGNTVIGNYIGTNAAGTVALGVGRIGIYAYGGSNNNILGGSASGMGNVVSGGNQEGICVDASTGTRIQGNYIGTTADGTAGLGNRFAGISIVNASNDTTIGGTAVGAGNVISGNGHQGIYISDSSSNFIQANYVGTNATGDAAIGNSQHGIYLTGSSSNTIGGNSAAARNIISGSGNQGLKLLNGSNNNSISGNFFSLNAAGTAKLNNNWSNIMIVSSTGNTVGGTTAGARNVIAGSNYDGVELEDASNNSVIGNYIGTNAAGTVALGVGRIGIYLRGSNNNIIGGSTAGMGNVVSGGNQEGICLDASIGNLIQGNYVGTTADGTAGLGNRYAGISIVNASNNTTIGGTADGAGNVIAGNASQGISIQSSSVALIQANYIGVNRSGSIIGNGGAGIYFNIGAHSNVIGGTITGAGNVIAYNGGRGVASLADMTIQGNQVLGNSIYGNTALGIDWGDDGVNLNDAGDGDTGANRFQNFPVITSATATATAITIAGTFNSNLSRSYRLEFFANTGADGTGYGEGQRYLGFVSVTTDVSGNATFNTTISATVLKGEWISATATDNTTNDTSEFSQSMQVITNHAPTGTDKTITIIEDTTYTFTAADFGFNDAGDVPPNNFLSVKIASVTGLGTLTNNGVAVGIGNFVFVSDINLGRLVFTPTLHGAGSAYASVSFQVKDDSGVLNADTDTSANTLTINVTAINHAPSGTNGTITTLEDKPYTFSAADFGFTDSQNTPQNNFLSVQITSISGGGSLTNAGVAVKSGDFILKSEIDLGRLVFSPSSNSNGLASASIAFKVKDDGGTTNGGLDLDPQPKIITVNLIAVNDAPFGSSKTITTLQNNTYTFIASDFGFVDGSDTSANNLLAIKITSLPTNGFLSNNGAFVNVGDLISRGDIDKGILVWTPVFSGFGKSYSVFSFQVRDDGGTANGGVDLDPIARTMTIDVDQVAWVSDNPGAGLSVYSDTNNISSNISNTTSSSISNIPSSGSSNSSSSGLTSSSSNSGSFSGISKSPAESSGSVSGTTSNSGNSFTAKKTQISKGQSSQVTGAFDVNDSFVNPAEVVTKLNTTPPSVGTNQPTRFALTQKLENIVIEAAPSRFNLMALDQNSVLQQITTNKNNASIVFRSNTASSENEKRFMDSVVEEQKNEGPQGIKLEPSEIKMVAAFTSIGAAMWALKQSTFLASLVASVPVWQRIDPLNIVAGDNSAELIDDDHQLDIADHMFSGTDSHKISLEKEGRE